eukprot:593931-Hanusia_phi.AAC.2
MGLPSLSPPLPSPLPSPPLPLPCLPVCDVQGTGHDGKSCPGYQSGRSLAGYRRVGLVNYPVSSKVRARCSGLHVDDQLLLYSLHQQASIGPCNTPSPHLVGTKRHQFACSVPPSQPLPDTLSPTSSPPLSSHALLPQWNRVERAKWDVWKQLGQVLGLCEPPISS